MTPDQADELLNTMPTHEQAKRLIELGESVLAELKKLSGGSSAWHDEVLAAHKAATPAPVQKILDAVAAEVADPKPPEL